MPAPLLTFLDFNLPNATTWFFFSFLLAMALFFKYSRLLSVRNVDVVMIFLLVPGLLVLQAARQPPPVEQHPATQFMALIGDGALADSPALMAGHVAYFTHQAGPTLDNQRWLWWGYLWVLLGSVYFFARCLVDLTLVQRPALAPNLQIGGLGWLAGALLVCLLAVAYRQVEGQFSPVPTNGHGSSGSALEQPPEQSVFAVAILWRGWPAWAVAALAFACHIAVVILLAIISWRLFQDLAGGMAAVTFYLVLPYTGMSMGQVHHVLPMALFLGAVLAYRSPTLTGAILGVATAVTYFPVFVLPIWLSFYRDRGMGRFLAAFIGSAALCLTALGWTLWAHGELERSIKLALTSAAWQPWVPTVTAEGFWTGVHWAYRIPVFLIFLSFVIGTMFWPTPKNLAHVIALCTAVFIALQWWCAGQGGLFVLWYLPLMLLLVFRPNLQDRVASPIVPDTDWLTRSWRWCLRVLRRVIRVPEAPEKKPV